MEGQEPSAAGAAADRAERREATFAALTALFGVVLVLTNIVGVKLFVLFAGGRPDWMPGAGPLTLTTGIITYPLTFLLTDLVSEIWGRKRANFMVALGFVMSLLMLGVVSMARTLPPSPIWALQSMGMGAEELQRAFDASFYYPGSLLFASMTAYLAAQLLDVRLYHFWWRRTGGAHMWVRNNGSTMISQLVDTVIVNSIFLRWAFELEWNVIAEIIVAVYLCKVLLAWLDTPLIYIARAWLRRFLGLGKSDLSQGAPLAGSR